MEIFIFIFSLLVLAISALNYIRVKKISSKEFERLLEEKRLLEEMRNLWKRSILQYMENQKLKADLV